MVIRAIFTELTVPEICRTSVAVADPAVVTGKVNAFPLVPAPFRSISVPEELSALRVIVLFRQAPAVVSKSPKVIVDALKNELADDHSVPIANVMDSSQTSVT